VLALVARIARSLTEGEAMCIGVPMKVVQLRAAAPRSPVGPWREARLDAMLVDDLRPGAWVLAFRGAAVRTMSEHEAAQTDCRARRARGGARRRRAQRSKRTFAT
jgi:hydrogenase assembly chaperone HypC/HupF